MRIPSPTYLGGRDVDSQSINEESNFGETNPVGNNRRSLLKFKSYWNEHGYGKKRDLRNSDWTAVGLIVEVNEEVKRNVVWNSYKGGLRSSIWVKRNQREHVVGPPRGSRVHTNPMVFKGGLRNSKWVSQREHVVGPSSGSQVHLLPVVGSDFEWASQEKSNKMPTVGVSLKSKLAQPDLGSTQLTEANFSSPSSRVMGESSVTTAKASSDEPKTPMLTEKVADRQAESSMVV